MREPDEPKPLTVELTADTSGITDAVRRTQASLMFGFHPDLTTPADRAVRYQMLRAWQAGEDFQESMGALSTQPGASPDEIHRLQAAVLRLAGGRGKVEDAS